MLEFVICVGGIVWFTANTIKKACFLAGRVFPNKDFNQTAAGQNKTFFQGNEGLTNHRLNRLCTEKKLQVFDFIFIA